MHPYSLKNQSLLNSSQSLPLCPNMLLYVFVGLYVSLSGGYDFVFVIYLIITLFFALN